MTGRGTLRVRLNLRAGRSSWRLRMGVGGSRKFVSSSTMDVKTLKEVRDIVQGSDVEIPAESSGFLEGITEEMMRI